MIRKATNADAPRIAEILIFVKRTAYRHIFKNDKVSFNEMQVVSLSDELLSTPGRLNEIYVYDDGLIKGMCAVKIISEENERQCFELKELYVDTFFQHCGIGKALLRYAEGLCQAQGIQEMYLWVLEKNAAAREFYEKRGLIPNGLRILEQGTTQYLLQYVKKIRCNG